MVDEKNTIRIKDKEYNLKFSLRGFILFEQIRNKPFEIKDITDSVTLAYSFLISSNKGLEMSFDEFIDDIDDDPAILTDILKAFANHEKFEAGLENKEKKVMSKQKAKKV